MATAYKGTKAEELALNAYIALMRAAESVTARMTKSVLPTGLTLSQFGVLEALYHLGPMCQNELGRKLLKSGGNITMVVDNLERRRLVHRERRPQDRRYFSVELTPTGEQLIAELFPRVVRHIRSEMEVVLDSRLNSLYTDLKAIGHGRTGTLPLD